MKFQKPFDKILHTRDDNRSEDKNQHICETEK